ncbi:MAG: alpha/beta hydrolase fold domain-containing protein [Acidimicrobiales bacterium]
MIDAMLRLVRRTGFVDSFASAAGDPDAMAALLARGRRFDVTTPPRRVRRRRDHLELSMAGGTLHVLTAPTGPGRRVLLYLHGGGYLIGPARWHWTSMAELADAAQADLAMLVYPKSPEHDHETTIGSALAAYDHVVERYGADHVVVGGDSAGGGLVATLLGEVRDRGRPVPRAALLISPWLDLMVTDPAAHAQASTDLLLTIDGCRAAGPLYAGALDPADPRVSPGFGSTEGFPPFHVFVGTEEIFLADCRAYVERAHREGRRATIREMAKGQHVAAIFPTPEGRMARPRWSPSSTGPDRPADRRAPRTGPVGCGDVRATGGPHDHHLPRGPLRRHDGPGERPSGHEGGRRGRARHRGLDPAEAGGVRGFGRPGPLVARRRSGAGSDRSRPPSRRRHGHHPPGGCLGRPGVPTPPASGSCPPRPTWPPTPSGWHSSRCAARGLHLRSVQVEGQGAEAQAGRHRGGSGARNQAAVARGAVIADAQAFARDLVNEPGGTLTAGVRSTGGRDGSQERPDGQGVGRSRDQAGEARLLGVNRGSELPPRLVELTYVPKGRPKHTVTLVGKGLVFDAGGLSIKTAQGMMTMKCDMGGGAAVIGAMSALPQLAPTCRVRAIVPMTDNMLGGDATRPGDVLTIRNGKTIEVLNTDAEGRLVLADALSLASEGKPGAIVDLATLTGACMVALGPKIAGLMGNPTGSSSDPRGVELVGRTGVAASSPGRLQEADRVPGGRHEEHGRSVRRGDHRGPAPPGVRLEGIPWAHLDIAGPAWSDVDDADVTKGGTGFGVRLLVDLVTGFRPPSGQG